MDAAQLARAGAEELREDDRECDELTQARKYQCASIHVRGGPCIAQQGQHNSAKRSVEALGLP
eukprot:10616066-Alexandrium_andersonii.AAC.1